MAFTAAATDSGMAGRAVPLQKMPYLVGYLNAFARPTRFFSQDVYTTLDQDPLFSDILFRYNRIQPCKYGGF